MTKRQVGILWGGDKEVTRSEGRGTIGWDRDPVRDGENCPRQGRVTGNGEKGTDGGGTGEVVGKDSGTDRGVGANSLHEWKRGRDDRRASVFSVPQS